MKKEVKIPSYRKYSLEWWFMENDDIWELISNSEYIKQIKIKRQEMLKIKQAEQFLLKI